MKIKWNWGTGIVIAMALFMVFILQFVYRASMVAKNEHSLVTEDYYKEEIHYQEEIDKVNKANALKENISIVHKGNGFMIQFPKDINAESLSGTVYFKRLSNEKLDFSKDIKENLVDHAIFIADDTVSQRKISVKN
ncbi:MAG: FixH family protein [Flavobacteriaceae bacterium]|nr:FixH family protein [Flavobacteriaceae bacterium]